MREDGVYDDLVRIGASGLMAHKSVVPFWFWLQGETNLRAPARETGFIPATGNNDFCLP
jgi:hypothetical protein